MTSEERHEGRAQRRRTEREAHRRERLAEYDNFDRVADYNSLYKAYKDARKGVGWKASVQRYGIDLGKNLCRTHNALINGEDVRKGFISFDGEGKAQAYTECALCGTGAAKEPLPKCSDAGVGKRAHI